VLSANDLIGKTLMFNVNNFRLKATGVVVQKRWWERTKKTSHFQQHFKPFLNQYLMKYSLSLHYK